MPEPFVGEIRMFGGNFAPVGWAFCDGQLIPISENDILFTLIGTTYGGDGQNTFALPNLQSRVPIHAGTGPSGVTFQLAEMEGTEQETLTTQQLPVHTHSMLASSSLANDANPDNNVLCEATAVFPYNVVPATLAMAPQSISSVGGSQPHENCQPFLCVNFIISLFGVYPTQ